MTIDAPAWATAAILAVVTVHRLGELALARRNTQRLLGAGAVERGAGHYPIIVLLHAAWLAGLWLMAWDRPLWLPFVAAFLILQGLRVWVVSSLGVRWTTRIVVVPGETLVARGPYRWLRHPNYAVVAGEIACLPLVFGMIGYAAAFSVLNAAILFHRIRVEEEALGMASGRAGRG